VTFGHLGSGLTDLLTDTTKLGTGIAGLTLLALGVYSTREGVRVAGKTFDRWFGTPRLVSLHAFFVYLYSFRCLRVAESSSFAGSERAAW